MRNKVNIEVFHKLLQGRDVDTWEYFDCIKDMFNGWHKLESLFHETKQIQNAYAKISIK